MKANRGQEKEVLNWKICQPWFSSSVLGFFLFRNWSNDKNGNRCIQQWDSIKARTILGKKQSKKKILSKRSLSPKKRISQKNVLQKILKILLQNTFSLTTLKTI